MRPMAAALARRLHQVGNISQRALDTIAHISHSRPYNVGIQRCKPRFGPRRPIATDLEVEARPLLAVARCTDKDVQHSKGIEQ